MPTCRGVPQARDQQRHVLQVEGQVWRLEVSDARKDYDDRRRRQAEGIKKAKAEGRYRGRKEDVERNAAIVKMLESGQSWNNIVKATGASRSTLARLAKRKLST